MQNQPQLQADKKLERRSWLGCLVIFVGGGILMGTVTALITWMIPARQTPGTGNVFSLLPVLVGLILVAGVGIGGLVLLFRAMRWSMQAEIQRHARGAEIFRHALPGLHLEREAQTPAGSVRVGGIKQLLQYALYLAGFVIAMLVVDAVIEQVWRDTPSPVIQFVNFALVVVFYILLPSSRPRQTQPGNKTPAKISIDKMRIVSTVLFFAIVMPPVLGVIPFVVQLSVPLPLLPIVALGVCGGIFMLMIMVYMLVPYFWIMGAVKRCDYAGAIARAQVVENLSIMRGFYLNSHGVILLWAGRYDEARQVFESSISEQRKEIIGGGSTALENIGCALAWQGKYDEAIKMFEGSIAMAPGQTMVYNDLAQVYLGQGIELPRALELTDRAWLIHQASFESRLLNAYAGGQILATRALALAQLGRYPEAEETLARAFKAADRKFKPVMAGIFWRAGQVMTLRNNPQKAVEYFTQGQTLDPLGHHGRLCAEALSR